MECVLLILSPDSVGGAQENTIATGMGLKDREGVEVDLISGPTQGPEGSLEASLGTFGPNC